ncbi:MAG TPA: helix-turn-helix domain-containing protein [Gemmatimonadaceae bacterium]|nr:helix-turn-helix domain-containing protein [Gemmatimonadaceae bacterium]
MTATQPVYFVLLPGTLLVDLAGPADAVRLANRYQRAVRFTSAFVSPTPSVTSSVGIDLAGLGPLPTDVPSGAMIVVCGTVTDMSSRTARLAVASWIHRVARPSHRLVFICAGALVAAEAGLLDGRACTTHHEDCDELRHLAPKARVLDNRLYVSDGNVYTSAGVTAGLDLMLALIADIAGPKCSVGIARHMVVYARRTGADPQLSPWLEGRNHIHPGLHRVQDAIAADPARAWTAAALAAVAHTSARHLTRLFQSHTAMSPLDYVHLLRVALARELLTNSTLDLERVAERSGFASSRQLRRVWNKYNTLPPSQSRQTFGQSQPKVPAVTHP